MQLLIIILAILVQVFLTIKKVSPFISLLIVAILSGLSLRMSPDALSFASVRYWVRCWKKAGLLKKLP